MKCIQHTPVVDHIRGETLCSICGEVLSIHNIPEGAEHIRGTEFVGNTIVGAPGTPNNRLNRYGDFSQTLVRGYKVIDGLSQKMALPANVTQDAHSLFRAVKKTGKLRGRSTYGMAAACVFIACRMNQTPRTGQDLVQVTGIRKNRLQRDITRVIRILDISVPPDIPFTQYIARICNKLKTSEMVKRMACNILNEVQRTGVIVGKRPMGVVAGVVYMACLIQDEQITQDAVCKAAGTSTVTLRKICNVLSKSL